ncbi:hypothetical protein ACU8NW_07055 [Rhizobium leguminosarum]
MRKIYLTFAHQDLEFAKIFTQALSNSDEVSIVFAEYEDSEALDAATFHMQRTSVFVPVVSEATDSVVYLTRIERLIGNADGFGVKTMPVVIGKPDTIPPSIRNRLYARAEQSTADAAAEAFLSTFAAEDAVKKREEVRRDAVRADVSEFVEEAIKTQKKAEADNRFLAHIWYISGVIFLGAVLALTTVLMLSAIDKSSDPSASAIVPAIAIVVLNLVIVGVFAALARYAYSLGKSYMTEALKSADRIHAIQFGKFYLKAYGDRLSPTEVKDAFQHWNIDRTSTFASLDPSHIDPQLLSLLTQLGTAIAGKRKSG